MERTLQEKNKRTIVSKIIFASVFLCFWVQGSELLYATQTERLAADRPGFAWGTHTVTPGSFYLETGFMYSFRTEPNFSNYSTLPVFNFRMGIADNLELFISWDGWDIYHQRNPEGLNTDNHELSLPLLGAKYQLFAAENFTFTLLGLLESNDDADSFTVDPSLALLWDYSLTDDLELFGMGQAGTISTYTGNEMAYSFAVGIGFPLGKNVDVFAEYFTMYDTFSKKLFHGNEAGILFFLNDNTQLDVFGGYSHENTIPHYLGAGISRRF